MAVRTKRLARATVGTTPVSMYTCSANETAIVKSIAVENTNGVLTAAVSVRFESAGVSYGALARNVPAGGVNVEQCWHVLHPGDQIIAQSTVAGARIWISGTELEGVAD